MFSSLWRTSLSLRALFLSIYFHFWKTSSLCSRISLPSFFFPPPFFSGLQLSSLLHLFRHCRNAQLLCCTIPSQWVLFFAPWLHSQSTISNHLYHFKRMRLPVPLLTTLQLFHTSLWPRGSHIALWCCNHCCPPQRCFIQVLPEISISKTFPI